jgi:hypothetical protein
LILRRIIKNNFFNFYLNRKRKNNLHEAITSDIVFTAPQNLASIFTKQKPKTSEKKESTPAQQVKSTKTVQSKNEGNKPPHISKPMEEAELKAANNAFNALFNTSKLVKTQVSVVPTCQQPTPWPTVSHVTQKNDDQSDEEFWKLSDSKIEALPWKPESVQGNFNDFMSSFFLSF